MHTKRSPSQAKRFLSCVGALQFCDTLPEEQRNQSGVAAQLGTATHGLIELCLREGREPEDYRDRLIELVGDDEKCVMLKANAKLPGHGRVVFEVDAGMIDGAECMTNYVRGRCAELGVPTSSVQLETRTNPLPERDDTSGTADVTIDAWPSLLEVVDYKNGWNVVEHNDNDQLRSYLLGKALEAELSFELYRVTVVQPNAPHEEGRVRSIDMTAKELLEFQKKLRAGIVKNEEAERAWSRFKPAKGEAVSAHWAERYLAAGDHCMFCDAQPICPARKGLAEKEAGMEFADEPAEMDLPDNVDGVERILLWAPHMEALIRAANAWALRAMESGKRYSEFKLVRGRSTRKLKDMPEAKLVAALIKGGYVKSAKPLYSLPKLLTGPQIEKVVEKKKRADFGKKFLVKPEGNLTVAHASDPRDAVVFNVGDEFDQEEFG